MKRPAISHQAKALTHVPVQITTFLPASTQIIEARDAKKEAMHNLSLCFKLADLKSVPLHIKACSKVVCISIIGGAAVSSKQYRIEKIISS